MIRKAFVMQLLPGFEAEYERRHDELWPEMGAMLREHGVSDYSIFLHAETLQLFGTLLIEDETLFAKVPETEVCQRWWRFMEDVMESHADGTPRATELRRVFHLE
ncbi:MAG: L-rhamnose mutarotase [Chthoniobacterales bacterium]